MPGTERISRAGLEKGGFVFVRLRYGDLTFDDAKESAKEKLQSKTTEKED